MDAPSLSLEELVEAKGEILGLELLTPTVALARECADADVSTPGLALAGHLSRYIGGRLQVFGETEMSYLAALPAEERVARLDAFFERDVPAAFVTKGQHVPSEMIRIAADRGVAIFRSPLSTIDFFRRIKPYLEAMLAPTTSVHGSLADVFGVGLLFMGRSGIGKSECVLDLVERGHRLVADDVVLASRRVGDVLIGRAHDLHGHHMEIRGVGIIDVRAIFGIRAVRRQKRIEVIVRLEEWDGKAAYDRTGLDRDEEAILGVSLPRVTVPLNPGKNITVVAEVIAMNHLLRYVGVDSAAEFDRRIREARLSASSYLETDDE